VGSKHIIRFLLFKYRKRDVLIKKGFCLVQCIKHGFFKFCRLVMIFILNFACILLGGSVVKVCGWITNGIMFISHFIKSVTYSDDTRGQICWLTLLLLMRGILISILNQKAGYPD